MKILTITYGYPPFHKGGYEIRCRDVMERLKQKGHEVLIVTTRHPSNRNAIKSDEPGIFRVLHQKFEPQSFPQRVLNDIKDTRFLKKTIEEFQPDVIYLWQIATLSSMIIPFCSKLHIPLFRDVADVGLIHDARMQKQGLYFIPQPGDPKIKNLLREMANAGIKFVSGNLLQPHWEWPSKMKINFNSENIKKDALDAGIPVEDARVIYAGVNTDIFTVNNKSTINSPLRIITPGRIVPLKGTRDSVLLLKYLINHGIDARLTLAGGVGDQDYFDDLQHLIIESGLGDHVTYPGMVSQEDLAKLYHQAEICFFPSYWKSGLSAVPLEAMASGCLVITYGNENSAEIIEDGLNGFIIPEGACEAAASLVQKMLDDQDQYGNIVNCARNEIEKIYTMDRYVEDIEAFLFESQEYSRKLMIEITNCPLCGSINKMLFSKAQFGEKHSIYWRCRYCGLIFQSPQMDEVELSEFYANHYREYLFKQVEPPQEDIEIQKARASHLVSILQKQCGNLEDSVHLDIGCGSGELIKECLSKLSTQSVGVEPDNAYRQYATNQGLTVFKSIAEWEKVKHTKAKLVTMSHVLEHMPDPAQTLSDIRNNVLDTSGFLLIEVPNLYFHQSFELPHNFAFSTHTLIEVIKKAGYKVVYLKRHGLPLKKTPRYITVLAQPIELGANGFQIKPEFPMIGFKRGIGRTISRVEDLINRYIKKIQRRLHRGQ